MPSNKRVKFCKSTVGGARDDTAVEELQYLKLLTLIWAIVLSFGASCGYGRDFLALGDAEKVEAKELFHVTYREQSVSTLGNVVRRFRAWQNWCNDRAASWALPNVLHVCIWLRGLWVQGATVLASALSALKWLRTILELHCIVRMPQCVLWCIARLT